MTRSRFPVWLTALLLALVTVALYWPATGHDFICYDDQAYVTDNPRVQAGLTWEGLAWAFGRVHGEGTYWHPLTWVSHMVDCQVYGLKPGGHHLTSVLLHAANAVLVFLVFRRMTGAFWRCVALAAFFALHPLQVDSVAWVAERKTLLSAFFWLLATGAYVRYAECRMQNPATRNTQHTTGYYLLCVFFFALGLMCKPVLVTFPFVLLLLDYWPLQRLHRSTLSLEPATPSQGSSPDPQPAAPSWPAALDLRLAGCLLREKTPFFVLAAAASVITILAHHAMTILDWLPWDARIENALVSYVRYLGKTFWPSRLAVFYPYPAAWPMWEVVVCGLLLLVISSLVLGAARSRPWWAVGWSWFLGVLVPFIGLVQAGEQAMADRFMYVPAIGILMAVIWGLHGLAKGGRYQQIGLSVAGGAALVLCLAVMRQQLGHWQDSETLFRHALEVTANNSNTHMYLGNALVRKGQLDAAISQFQEAIHLKPDDTRAQNNLGIALVRKGQMDAAISQYQEAIRLQPDNADTHYNLGIALGRKGQMDAAISQFQEALRLQPDNANAHINLGVALGMKGQLDGAISQLQEALRLKPDSPDARNNLARVLALKNAPASR